MKVKNVDISLDKIQTFCIRWKVIEFTLFGSVLRDDFHSGSDIDVMVQFDSEAHRTFTNIYDDVNLNIVWDVIQKQIPALIKELKSRIPPKT